MVSPQVVFVIVDHHVHREQALILAESIGTVLMIDTDGHGTNWNHRRTLEWAANQSYRVVVPGDDTIPVAGFREKAAV